jgi:hypothetical protein
MNEILLTIFREGLMKCLLQLYIYFPNGLTRLSHVDALASDVCSLRANRAIALTKSNEYFYSFPYLFRVCLSSSHYKNQ